MVTRSFASERCVIEDGAFEPLLRKLLVGEPIADEIQSPT